MQLYETQRFSYEINNGQIFHFMEKSGLFLELEAWKMPEELKGKNKYWLECLGSEKGGW